MIAPRVLALGRLAPWFDPTAFVAPGAFVIGDVVLGEGSSVWFGCVLRGDVQRIIVGARTNIQDGTVVHGTTGGHPVLIGNEVTVGHGAVLHACTLADRSFVGIGAVVLDGAVVESGAMVAARALVPPGKVVRSGELWAGVPARCLRPLGEPERTNILVSARRYVDLARQHREGLADRWGETTADAAGADT